MKKLLVLIMAVGCFASGHYEYKTQYSGGPLVAVWVEDPKPDPIQTYNDNMKALNDQAAAYKAATTPTIDLTTPTTTTPKKSTYEEIFGK